jgi:mannitol-1-phosphate/altronate dehydrogenase
LIVSIEAIVGGTLTLSPVATMGAWVVAANEGLPSIANYGFAGAVIAMTAAGVAWWGRYMARREEAQNAAHATERIELRASHAAERAEWRAQLLGRDQEIKELNDRMLTEVIPLTTQVATSAAQITRWLDNAQVDIGRRRERG